MGGGARARPVVPGYTSFLMSWEMMRNLVRDEWVILSLLLAWSLAGLAVICERLYALWNLVPKSEAFKNRVIDALERGDIAKATALCEMSQVPIADVFERGLLVYGKTPEKTTEAVTSQRNATVLSLKRYLWALGTVGSSAPFVGLFGTVVGILKAFQSMSVAGTGGFKVVSQGIAAALVATAAGLLVAIYAVIAYNYFVARIGVIAMHYRLFAEEFLTALGQGVKRKPAVVAVAAGAENRDAGGLKQPWASTSRSTTRAPPSEDGEVGADSVVAEINITPLTDVFLVLLIIFMVTSTALVESEVASRAGMKVVLPKANAAGPVSQRRSDPVLTVTRANELYLGSRKLDPTNLEGEIRKALAETGSETLLIRGDKNVYLGSAVDIMSVAKKAGASKIAILTAPNK